jgi:hypothetical protein
MEIKSMRTGRKVTLTFECFFTDNQWKNTADRDLIDIAYSNLYEGEVSAVEKVRRYD